MAILEFQTQIGAPPEAVFSYVSDLEKHVDWSGGQAIRKTSEGTIAVGSTYETQEQGPFGMTFKEKSEVIEYRRASNLPGVPTGRLEPGLTGRLKFVVKTEKRSWLSASTDRMACWRL